MTNETAYLVTCWRGRQSSCRAFATLAEARAAAAQHVRDAADAFTDGGNWARELKPEPDRTVARDLADGTRIRVRLVSADTARCLR